MRKSLFATAAVVGALAAAVIAPGVSNAVPTTVTFTVAGGALEITANGTAALTQNGDTATGSIGNVKVTDNRRGIGGWTASAVSSSFTKVTNDETAIPAANVNYQATGLTTTGLPVIVPAILQTNIATNKPVLAATATIGANTATWNGAVTVNLPVQVVAGDYSGTITHSVA